MIAKSLETRLVLPDEKIIAQGERVDESEEMVIGDSRVTRAVVGANIESHDGRHHHDQGGHARENEQVFPAEMFILLAGQCTAFVDSTEEVYNPDSRKFESVVKPKVVG